MPRDALPRPMNYIRPMILVTGANGFIGSAMVWDLNNQGRTDVVAVDSVPRAERDLLKKRKFQSFLLKDDLWSYLGTAEAQKIQWVLHIGACSSTTETNWDFLKENNLEYSQRIFEWCAHHGKSLIYASSGATYGDGSNGFSDKTPPGKLRALNLYGESKLLMDRWALTQEQTPPNWYGVRYFNVFGPNEYLKGSMASVAFKAFHQIRETGELGLFKSANPAYRDGEQLRDFVYVKDVTRWMRELMENKPASGIYNMGFGRARTWLDLARATFEAMGKEMRINWLEMPDNLKSQYQYFTEADMSKWKEAGMSEAQWPLELAVRDYVREHLNSEDPWL